MKKLTFLLPLAVAAMVSCSNSDEVFESAPQVKNTELKLFPQIQGNTRGVVETTASLSSFEVILNGSFATAADGTPAANAYGPLAVTKGADGWSMATKYYWGDDTTPALFTAYANNGTAAYTAGTIKDFIVDADDPANHKDLIVAYNSGSKTDFASGVPLHFQHALAQIIVNANYTFNNDVATDYPDVTVKVKGVKFVNVDQKGTLTLPTTSTVSGYTADWTLGNTLAKMASVPSVAVELGSANQVIDNSAVAGPMLFIPQTQAATTDLTAGTPSGAYLIAQVDIDYKVASTPDGEADARIDLYPKPATMPTAGNPQTAADGTYAWIAVPLSIDWKAGYKYTYTLNFSNAAFGKIAPAADGGEGDAGDPIVDPLLSPVTFLVTVEEEWQAASGNYSPSM